MCKLRSGLIWSCSFGSNSAMTVNLHLGCSACQILCLFTFRRQLSVVAAHQQHNSVQMCTFGHHPSLQSGRAIYILPTLTCRQRVTKSCIGGCIMISLVYATLYSHVFRLCFMCCSVSWHWSICWHSMHWGLYSLVTAQDVYNCTLRLYSLTLNKAKASEMHLKLGYTTLLDCTLYPQYPYDADILRSSANWCVLGKV